LVGLQPWQEVTVEFIDPLGRPAQWVTENDVVVVGSGGVPLTTRDLFADGSGDLSWVRVGARDLEGQWSVRVTIDGETSPVTYSVSQLQLPSQETETLGVELRQYQGAASNTLYSALVPAALAVDLQAHLAWAADRLWDDLGIQSRQIPDIYLAGNRSLLQQVAQATGNDIGFEDGFYRSGGTRPGIYMRADFFGSGIRAILTHEYTHLLLQEAVGDQALPAWLNEGVARNSEYRLGLEDATPNAVRIHLYRDADMAKEAALSASLPSLTTLESQADWNAQTDQALISLQYAEAYMAVRFMTETYGSEAPVDAARAVGRGSPLLAAILEVTGTQYRDFRERFEEWLRSWEDPERVEIRTYIRSLNSIMDSEDSLSDRRTADLQSGTPLSSRVPVKRALAADAAALQEQLEDLSPPTTLMKLHQDASTYLVRVVQWLNLELEYVETLERAKLEQANGMLPEVNARESDLVRAIATIQLVYNLDE
jgi:hypothetical protein